MLFLASLSTSTLSLIHKFDFYNILGSYAKGLRMNPFPQINDLYNVRIPLANELEMLITKRKV